MWQIEDMIRANDFDISKIRRNIIDNFQIDDAQKHEMDFAKNHFISKKVVIFASE